MLGGMGTDGWSGPEWERPRRGAELLRVVSKGVMWFDLLYRGIQVKQD